MVVAIRHAMANCHARDRTGAAPTPMGAAGLYSLSAGALRACLVLRVEFPQLILVALLLELRVRVPKKLASPTRDQYVDVFWVVLLLISARSGNALLK